MPDWLKKGLWKLLGILVFSVVQFVIAGTIAWFADFSPKKHFADWIFPSIEGRLISSIKKEMDPDKYIEKYLSQGRFVPIKENGFASKEENEIESIKFSMSDSEKRYVTLEELRNERNSLESLRSTVSAKSEGFVTVEIYKSEIQGEEERLILNGKNEAISHWIKNGYCYKVKPTRGEGHLHIKVAVHGSGVTRPDKQETNDSIGRLHQKHRESLFTGRTAAAGLKEIDVRLTPTSENCDDLRMRDGQSRRSD